jgi:hypothetical protein
VRFDMLALPGSRIRQHQRLDVITQTFEGAEDRPHVTRGSTARRSALMGNSSKLAERAANYSQRGDCSLELCQLAIRQRANCTEVCAQQDRGIRCGCQPTSVRPLSQQ